MAKLRVPSWLQSSSSSSSAAANGNANANAEEAERKKQNRRSLSGLAQFISKNDQPAQAPAAAPATDAVPKSSTSHMIDLAKKITEETEKLDKYLKDNGLPNPGFDVDAPGDFPKLPADVQQSRQEIVYATKELNALVRGPRETVRWGVWSFLDTLSLNLINSYGIAKLVPLDAPIELAELQTKTALDPINLARALRHAMTNHIFQEPSPGLIAHTAASRMLAEDGPLQDWVGFNGEDIFPAASHALRALRAHPEGTELTRTGFNFAFGTVDKEPMFATFGKDPARARRMGGAMASLTGGEGYEVSHFVDNYDLSNVDAKEGTFVDIGGSHGFVCVDLGKKWKKTKFVVQDLQKTVDSAPSPISSDGDVAQRVTLQAHDFFTEQPVHGADVYYFRWILHNYSTPYAIKIIKGLIPALKPGARVVINDHCLRDAGAENPWDDKIMRSMDMVMLALLNAQERTETEFRELFKTVDERFVFKGVTRTPGCRMSVVEAVWMPESVEKAEAEEVEEAKDEQKVEPVTEETKEA
ncbi:putative O-methyltransferase [Dactylonectria macrodidyma]|uniref:O-methyltransferase n=1 Tax=Dactylonectria macrodidyma TaxID=307937 RepID=A0A9P9JQP3_9HYPO|nr:putative O-methyltransferase [Dactylonectria macrodidyma]